MGSGVTRRVRSASWCHAARGSASSCSCATAAAACGDDDESSATVVTVGTGPTGTSSQAPATGSAGAGDGEVVVGAVLEPTSLNLIAQAGAALDQVLLDNVYETLLTATAEGDVEGGLTDLPEISDDGLTYTFTPSQTA